jgi:cobalt-zinc-cadmium efflux system protein
MDAETIAREMTEVEHVRAVHDLHIWTVTSGFVTLAAHIVVEVGADRDLVRRVLEVMLRERYGVEHTTLQMEEEAPAELLNVEGS